MSRKFDSSQLLGNRISKALSRVGITDERVSRLVGRPCGCSERRKLINRLDLWARRILSGKTDDARKHFHELMEDYIQK